MQAHIGDEIIIDGHVVGESRRIGKIVDVRGEDGGPPYEVQWDDSDHTTLLYPSSDAHIKHLSDEPSD